MIDLRPDDKKDGRYMDKSFERYDIGNQIMTSFSKCSSKERKNRISHFRRIPWNQFTVHRNVHTLHM